VEEEDIFRHWRSKRFLSVALAKRFVVDREIDNIIKVTGRPDEMFVEVPH